MMWKLADYTLNVIEDEATPLAGGIMSGSPEKDFFVWFLAGLAAVVMVIAVAFYMVHCNKYRARYKELIAETARPEEYPKAGWNVVKLKALVADTESRIASKML